MAAPSITILWNSTSNDTVNTGGAAGDSNFKTFDTVNDEMAFLGAGTDDQDANSSKDVFVIPEAGTEEIPRQFVNDFSESKWDRVFLAGSDDNRYVYGAYIDGTSATIPILQAWDSTAHDSYDLEILGSGTPADSMLKAVPTLAGTPGADWAGTPLAGDGGSNTIELDSGPIIVSKMVYWNMKVDVPSSANPFATNPILAIYVTYS